MATDRKALRVKKAQDIAIQDLKVAFKSKMTVLDMKQKVNTEGTKLLADKVVIEVLEKLGFDTIAYKKILAASKIKQPNNTLT